MFIYKLLQHSSTCKPTPLNFRELSEYADCPFRHIYYWITTSLSE